MRIQRKYFSNFSLSSGNIKIHHPQLSVKHFYYHRIKWKTRWSGRFHAAVTTPDKSPIYLPNSIPLFLFLKKSRPISCACSRENILIDFQYISLKIRMSAYFLITEHLYLQHLQQIPSKRMCLQKDTISVLSRHRTYQQSIESNDIYHR